MSDLETRGFVFNIQAFSIHDGPGIRTVCFLKGCPLSCKWCSNPESQKMAPEIAFDARKCIHCHNCVEACSTAALSAQETGVLAIDRESCSPVVCVPEKGGCVSVCGTGALFVYGYGITVDEALARIEDEAAFYGRSGGGLTLSGGEALLQPAFSVALLREARGRGIHTCMETTAFAARETLLAACEHLDYLIADIKLADSRKHLCWTGVSNEIILQNIMAARRAFPELPFLIRTPLVPGVNDDEEEIVAIAQIVKKLGNAEYEILPYHALGAQKYAYLGRQYEPGEIVCPAGATEKMRAVAERTLGRGLKV